MFPPVWQGPHPTLFRQLIPPSWILQTFGLAASGITDFSYTANQLLFVLLTMLLCEYSAGKHPRNPRTHFPDTEGNAETGPTFPRSLHILLDGTAIHQSRGCLRSQQSKAVWRIRKTCPRSSASRSWSLDRTQEFWCPWSKDVPNHRRPMSPNCPRQSCQLMFRWFSSAPQMHPWKSKSLMYRM